MDPFKLTTIGHRDMALCSPLSEERLVELVKTIALPESPRILDVGAGKAELAIRILERHGGSAVAVDMNPHFIAEAATQAARRLEPGALRAVTMDAAELETDERFDLVICVGARPFGDRRANLLRLAETARPGGQLLIGEGYWRDTPDPEYLRFLGASEADGRIRFRDHIELALRAGLDCVHAFESSAAEMDRYDGDYASSVERHLAEVPDDPDAEAMRGRIRPWREAFVRWGRSTMGFGWYLYSTQGPAGTASA